MHQRIRCDNTRFIHNDPKQMLISELNRQNHEESSRINHINDQVIDRKLAASDVYIMLDSIHRNTVLSNVNNGVFTFDLRNDVSSGNQIIGITSAVNNVIEIEIQSFPMPWVPLYVSPPMTTGVFWNNGAASNLSQFPTNRFMLQIEETAVQSVSDSREVRHNFEFDITDINGQLYAVPVFPTYIFTNPIASLDRLTMKFYSIYNEVEFTDELLVNSGLRIQTQILNNPNNPTDLFIHSPNHRLENGTKIHITNLERKTLPRVIYNYLTRKEGLYVGNPPVHPIPPPPIATTPIPYVKLDESDYFLLNPAINMNNFILTNSNPETIKTTVGSPHSFKTVRSDQIVVVIPRQQPITNFTISNKTVTINGTLVDIIDNIIALSGQTNTNDNGYYRIEGVEDIMDDGLRLTRATLSIPSCTFTVEVPSRRLRIPVRMKRVLKK